MSAVQGDADVSFSESTTEGTGVTLVNILNCRDMDAGSVVVYGVDLKNVI